LTTGGILPLPWRHADLNLGPVSGLAKETLQSGSKLL
jgi:hypothetical protein